MSLPSITASLNLNRPIAALKESRFAKDRISLAMLLPAVLLNVAALLILASKLHPVDILLPTRYSNLEGFNNLAPWYSNYLLGLFGLGVTVTNATLALISFNRSRITSFLLLLGALVCAMFVLIMCAGFAAIVR